MNHLNQIILEGNLIKDSELKHLVTGGEVLDFTIAVNRTYRKRNGETAEEVSYFDIKAYDNMAKMLFDKLEKGRGIRVVGRLKQKRWKNGSGGTCSKVIVVAEHVELKVTI